MALVYALLIGGMLCAVGLAGSYIRSLFRQSERGVWLLILIVASAGPFLIMRWAQHEPAALEYQTLSLPSWFVVEGTDQQSVAADGRQGIAVPASPAAIPSHPPRATVDEKAPGSLDQFIARLWIVLSAGAMVVISTASLAVRRRARQWTADQLLGIPVRVSDDVGPAVVGILCPFIVVPRRLFAKSAAVQKVAMTHELEHIRARDPALWRLGLVFVALIPWNPIMWWQLRKLRFAIDKDCDQRARHWANSAIGCGITVHTNMCRRCVCSMLGAGAAAIRSSMNLSCGEWSFRASAAGPPGS